MFKREQQARAPITMTVLIQRINGDYDSPFLENGLFFLLEQNVPECSTIAQRCATQHEGQNVDNATGCISISNLSCFILPQITSHYRTVWAIPVSGTINNLTNIQFPIDALADETKQGDALDLSQFDLETSARLNKKSRVSI